MDNLNWDGKSIKEFLRFAKNNNYIDNTVGYALDKFRESKQPKPILTTEDGIEIYSRNHPKLYWIFTATNYWKIGLDEVNSLSEKVNNRDYKYFFVKEKAEEYKLLNQPCLSVNDLLLAGWHGVESKLKALASKKQNTHTVNHKQ